MLTYKQKSDWLVTNQGRITKVQKEIKSLEELIAQVEIARECLDHNFHRDLQKFTGNPDEYNAFFEQHEADIVRCADILDEKISKLHRLESLFTKLRNHEKVIFALPHTW